MHNLKNLDLIMRDLIKCYGVTSTCRQLKLICHLDYGGRQIDRIEWTVSVNGNAMCQIPLPFYLQPTLHI